LRLPSVYKQDSPYCVRKRNAELNPQKVKHQVGLRERRARRTQGTVGANHPVGIHDAARFQPAQLRRQPPGRGDPAPGEQTSGLEQEYCRAGCRHMAPPDYVRSDGLNRPLRIRARETGRDCTRIV
jgi:hypothetical protein